jgi:hypothetical protein
MDDREAAADLSEIADEYAEIEADDDDQGEDDAPAEVVYMRRRTVRGSLPPR